MTPVADEEPVVDVTVLEKGSGMATVVLATETRNVLDVWAKAGISDKAAGDKKKEQKVGASCCLRQLINEFCIEYSK
ncbi:MAG: hypothetical protein RIS64_3475 [Bacteroidota bacterium]